MDERPKLSPEVFPFERGPFYEIGLLRAFEKLLSASRQNDQCLSAKWRVAKGRFAEWVKMREETYPLKLLADHKSFSDRDQFRLMPLGYPDPTDIELKQNGMVRNLQITSAFPAWIDGLNGGYEQRLVMETLNKGQPVVGVGGFVRDGADISSRHLSSSPQEDFNACVKGLVAALNRKRGHSGAGCELVVFARQYHFNTIDVGFDNVVAESLKTSGRLGFDRIYILDEKVIAEA